MAKRHIVSMSGGKDSTATWLHILKELRIPCEAIFADTGHESPVTYRYVDYLERELGPVVRVQGDMSQLRRDLTGKMTMLTMAKHKKRFPSPRARFCTTELKLRPMRKWLLAEMEEEPCGECGAGPGERCSTGGKPRKISNKGNQPVCKEGRGATIMQVVGTRAEESPKRARMNPEPTYDPWTGTTIWRPIHNWTHDEVFACHARHDIYPNRLYLEGMGRVGCFPCIMARKGELAAIATRYPEAYDRLHAMEQEVGMSRERGLSTFFAFDKCAQRYRRSADPVTGIPVATALDVRDWALNNPVEGETRELRFDEQGEDTFGPACVSVYGLCE